MDLSFYEKGFRYYTMVDDEHNAMVTRLNYCYFGRTPEKLMLDLCQSYKVIGLSATAEIDSGIKNFDLGYLRYRLQDRYVSPTKEDKDRMREEFLKNQNYQNIQIHTGLIGTGDKYSDQQWFNIIEFEDVSFHPLVSVLAKYEINDDYLKDRYYRISMFFSQFIQKDVRSALCFLTTLPGEKKNGVDLCVLRELFKIILDFSGSKDFNPQRDIVVLESSGFDERKKSTLDRLSKGDKIFIMSCYSSIGSGQNLQYSIPEGWLPDRDFIKINDRKSNEKDIDMIYVDKPTNILINTNRELSRDEMIHSFYDYETLHERNEISIVEMRNLNTVSFMSHNKRPKDYSLKVPDLYRSDTLNKSITSIIIQAIGRICRTPNKSKDIYVYGDRALVPLIDTSILDSGMNLNVECRTFFEMIRDEQREIKSPAKDDTIKKLINKGEKNSLKTGGYINRQLNNITMHVQGEETIAAWREMRMLALCYPTMSREKAESVFYSQFYVELPEKGDYLYYHKLNDKGGTKISFKQTREVHTLLDKTGAFLPDLMSHSFIHEYFEKCGYATDWIANDFIMTPPFFNNIYKGALGEAAVYAYFEHFLMIKLQEIIDTGKFEKFDFVIPGTDIYVDAKNWHTYFTMNKKEYLEKVHKKMEACEAKVALILNIMNENEDEWANHKWEFEDNVLMISALLPRSPEDMGKAWVTENMNKIMEVIDCYGCNSDK